MWKILCIYIQSIKTVDLWGGGYHIYIYIYIDIYSLRAGLQPFVPTRPGQQVARRHRLGRSLEFLGWPASQVAGILLNMYPTCHADDLQFLKSF